MTIKNAQNTYRNMNGELRSFSEVAQEWEQLGQEARKIRVQYLDFEEFIRINFTTISAPKI